MSGFAKKKRARKRRKLERDPMYLAGREAARKETEAVLRAINGGEAVVLTRGGNAQTISLYNQ